MPFIEAGIRERVDEYFHSNWRAFVHSLTAISFCKPYVCKGEWSRNEYLSYQFICVSGQCGILAAISISKGPDLHIHVYTYRDQFPSISSIDNPSVGSLGKWKEDGNRLMLP
jgi:hypothetical protein